jgi:integrase/recombinase XerC
MTDAATIENLPIIEQFMSYLLDERHFSPYTSRCYGVDLRQYAEYITEEHSITAGRAQEAEALQRASGKDTGGPGNGPVAGQVGTTTITGVMLSTDVEGIRGFLEHLSGQNYSPATMARKIATLRSFHRWLEKRGLISTNPMLMIRTPKQSKRLPKAIDVEQVERLLAAPDDTNLLGARDRAILETLYSTGIRVSELVGIDRGDVDETNAALIVRGKGRKERIVPLGSHALAALRHYIAMLDAEQQANGKSEGESPLFINKHGGRRRPALGPGAARPPVTLDDTGLHPPDHLAYARGLRRGASPGGVIASNPPRGAAAFRGAPPFLRSRDGRLARTRTTTGRSRWERPVVFLKDRMPRNRAFRSNGR